MLSMAGDVLGVYDYEKRDDGELLRVHYIVSNLKVFWGMVIQHTVQCVPVDVRGGGCLNFKGSIKARKPGSKPASQAVC